MTIDGEELHVMQNADGTWISVINHYDPVATPKAVARAAVRELQGHRSFPSPSPDPIPHTPFHPGAVPP